MNPLSPQSIFDIPNYLLLRYADPNDNGRTANLTHGPTDTVILLRPASLRPGGTKLTLAVINQMDNPAEPSSVHWRESRFLVFGREVEIGSFNQGEPTVTPILELRATCDNPAINNKHGPTKPFQKEKGHWIWHKLRVNRGLENTIVSDPSLDWMFPYLRDMLDTAHELATNMNVRGHWEIEATNQEFRKEE